MEMQKAINALVKVSAVRPATTSSKLTHGLTPAEEGADQVVVLRLPFDDCENASVPTLAVLTKKHYDEAATVGSYVADEVVTSLSFFEERYFEKCVLEIEVEAGKTIGDRVRFLRLDHFRKLRSRMPWERTWLQRFCAKVRLSDLSDIDLVCIPVTGRSGGHFAYAFWLPADDRIFHFDSYSLCELFEEMEQVILPFAQQITDASIAEGGDQPRRVVTPWHKDATDGIEEQAIESNVCAFTATMFQQQMLRKLLDLYRKMPLGRPVSSALFTFAHELTSQAATYEKRRRLAVRDLEQLGREYAEYVALLKRKSAESSVPSSKRSKPNDGDADGDNDSSPLELSEDEDEDDDEE